MKPMTSIASLAALTLLIAACSSSGSAGTVPPLEPTPAPSVAQGSPDLTPEPSGSQEPSGSPIPSSGPTGSPAASPAPEGTTVVRAYFHLSEGTEAGLVPILREVPATKAVATAAITELLAGPPESERGVMSSAVPAGTRLLALTIKSGVATVDLSSEFESGGGTASINIRLGQVVYTLTQFPTVKSVLFRIDGETVTVFGSEGIVLDGPVARADFIDLLPALFVDRPAFRAALGNPGRLTGSGQGIWEAAFMVTLLDGGGHTIAEQQAMAACWCESGEFDVTVRYDVPKAQWGTLRVWAHSAKDGSPVAVSEYPVWLTPAG
jgi:germination protein M